MAQRFSFDKIELHLVRVLHVLITERNVSRAALKLHSTQPVVSAQLKRLRELTGDPLLVRAGTGMAPTETALQLVGPAASLLAQAERLFNPAARSLSFDPLNSSLTFRIAASDYLDPLFQPELVARLQRLAPLAHVELHTLSGEFDYRRSLAAGEVDLVIGNWLAPPAELHLGRLLSDEIVCLVSADHPVTRMGEAWNLERYLECQHIAPMPTHPGAQGVIDEHLLIQGLRRNIAVRSSHFSQIPRMVAQSLLVLTTGRLYCSRFAESMPVRIVRCPAPFPPLTYYQLWHEISHSSAPLRWLRDQVKEVARSLSGQAPAN